MSKDINIHIKTPGAQQSKQQLDEVAGGAKKIGSATEEMGSKGQRALTWLTDGLKQLAGTLGFAALAAAISATAVKVAKFFDDLKTKTDEAVRNVQELRGEYDALFEAFSAFDEKSRESLVKNTNLLLQETGVSQKLGLSVVNAYARQFKDTMATADYEKGIRGMLGYAARHGGEATSDLISIMAGWGMTGVEQQGQFRRMIAAGAASSGLTDAEVISALSRGMPAIKAMGWTPAKAVENIALLARGEAGRKKMSMPATTIEALGLPQTGNLAKYGIAEELAEDPQKLLATIYAMQQTMAPEQSFRMLRDIYGTEAAAGISKLLTAQRGSIREALIRAAGPAGIEAEQAEERARMTTLEAREAMARAKGRQYELDLTEKEKYEKLIRTVGAEKQKLEQRRRPVRQWFQELLTIGENREKEVAAFNAWLESLSEEEKEEILRSIPEEPSKRGEFRLNPYLYYWRHIITPRERFEDLMRQSVRQPTQQPVQLTGAPGDYHVHYHSDTMYNPIVGREDVGGPRVSRDIR